MSEITSDDTGGTNQITLTEDTKETAVQECSPTGDATADELFDSFMEIANDPKLQNNDQTDGTLDQTDTIEPSQPGEQMAVQNGTLDQSESAKSKPDSQVKEMNNTVFEQTGMQNETPDQVDAEVPGSLNPNSQAATIDNDGEGEKTSPVRSSDLEREEYTESVPVDGQITSDNDPVQFNATDIPTESSEQMMSNPVIDESKPSGDLETSASSVTENKDERTEEHTSETESFELGSENKNIVADGSNEILGDSKEQSTESTCTSQPDHAESLPNKSDLPGIPHDKDPEASKTEVAQRLSKAMEDLAGLEQQLSSAVSEFKISSSEKMDESHEGEEVKTEPKDGQMLESKNEEQLGSGSLVAEMKEKNEVVSQDSGELSALKSDEGSNVAVCETGKEGVICEPAVATDLLNKASSANLNNEAASLKNDELSPKDTARDLSEVTADSLESQSDKTENSVVTLEGDKQDTSETENSIASLKEIKQDVSSNTTDFQVDNDVLAATASSGTKENGSQGDLDVRANADESPEETLMDESRNVAEASLEKSDSADELDQEVSNPGMTAVPGIEITVTDESKSLDSLDTEGSSNSRPTSPAASDEGIDSDTPSDYGDDDEAVFDPENLSSSRRKSWLLETDRDRLSSDSSTVSEKDFKQNYDKGDHADGKSPKEDYIRGHLLKMGGTGLTPKNWRKRWFVLRSDNCLYYYKHSKDKMPCGVIILSNYSVSKAPEINKSHCFKLTKGGARTYHMCAGSDSDMKKWMVAVMDAVKESSNNSNPFTIMEGNVHNVSIPALSIRDPDCHGYLYKQGNNYKIWRRRYFVLKNGFLYYYSDMANTVALGVAKLLNYTIDTGEHSGKKFYFSAVSPDKSTRSYFFAAESEIDRTRWLSRLEDSIKKGSPTH